MPTAPIRIAVVASMMLATLSLGAANAASGGSAIVTFVSAFLAFGFLAGAGVVATVNRRRVVAADEQAFAVTTLSGELMAANHSFRVLMDAHGLNHHPDALATDQGKALALFCLRAEAVRLGEASGYVAPVFVTIRQSGEQLIHRLEPSAIEAPDPAAPSAHHSVIVDMMPGSVAIAAPDGTVRAANASFRGALGDAAHLGDIVALPPGGLVRGIGGALEVPLKRDLHRRLRLSIKPLAAGQDTIVLVNDVTEQTDLEAQIAQSQKMQAVGQLAGGIAHDFNNVLTAIIGFSDLLLQNHRPSDPAFRDIMNIKQSAQRAAGLVKQLLAFSRRQTLRPQVINLNDAIADLQVMLDRLLGETVRLDITYGRDLSPVLADVSQIEQVIINLAVNARDAMKGGGTLMIRTRNVTLSEDEARALSGGFSGEGVEVEIEDTGTGIPQAIIDKIFEPFFTTKGTGEGTGLGLSTVYGIVKQTGGSLSVSSEEGVGTTFRVVLPRANAEMKPPEVRVEGEGANADLTGKARLLLVEDEEAIRTFAARALAAKGYMVRSAASGLEAMELFDEDPDAVDLLLTDVIMPELDGPGLVQRVRRTRPDLKVIFMSGYADGASVDDLGGAQFLPKPFTLKALAEAVKRELA